MLGGKARKRHRKVKTHCNIAPAVVFKAEHLLFGLAVGFSKQNLGVFKNRRINRHKTERTINFGEFFYQSSSLDFRRRKKIAESF